MLVHALVVNLATVVRRRNGHRSPERSIVSGRTYATMLRMDGTIMTSGDKEDRILRT